MLPSKIARKINILQSIVRICGPEARYIELYLTRVFFSSRPTGDVVTVDCVEKIIKKDMLHPLTGIALKEKDIIYLQRGGTGYAATNEKLKASHYRPNLAIA